MSKELRIEEIVAPLRVQHDLMAESWTIYGARVRRTFELNDHERPMDTLNRVVDEMREADPVVQQYIRDEESEIHPVFSGESWLTIMARP